MTKHNATWYEELYYGDDEIAEEDVDQRSKEHGKSGYWDYREDE